MWLEAEKARNFNAVVWVLGEVNGYHYVDLFFNLLSDKSTDRRADITHSVMAVLRKDFIGFTRLPWPGGGPPLGGPPPGGGAPPGGSRQASSDQIKQLGAVLEQYDLNNLSED